MVLPSVGPINTYGITQEFQNPANPPQVNMGSNLSFSTSTYLPGPTISSSGTLKKFSNYKGKKKINDWAGGFASFDPEGVVTPYGCTYVSTGKVAVVGAMNGTLSHYNSDTSQSSIFTSSISARNGAFYSVYNATSGAALLTSRLITDSGTVEARDCASDAGGNVFMVGFFSGTLASVNPATKYTLITSYLGGQDAYICKFRDNGTIPAAVAKLSSSGTDTAYGVAVDSTGNVYVTGQYGATGFKAGQWIWENVNQANWNTGDWWSGGSQSNVIPTVGGNDVFLVKYAPVTDGYPYSEGVKWIARAGSTASDSGFSVAVEPGDANVYIVGTYAAALSVFNSANVSSATMTYSGGVNAFLIKYGSDGSYKWSANLSATTGTVVLNSVVVDAGSNVIAGGYYDTTVSIWNRNGTLWGTRTNASTVAGVAGIVVKYNSEGAVQWAGRNSSTTTGVFGSNFNRVAVDSESNIYGVGIFTQTANIWSGSDVVYTGVTLTVVGVQDMLVAKWSQNGEVAHTRRAGSTGDDRLYGISCSGTDTWTAGYYSGTLTSYHANNVAFANTLALTASSQSGALVKANTAGTVQQTIRFGSTTISSQVRAVCSDNKGNVYVTGQWQGWFQPCDYSGGGLATGNYASTVDIFIAKYSYEITGGLKWWAYMKGAGTSDVGYGISVDAGSNVYVSGTFSANMTIYNSDGSSSLSLTLGTGIDSYLVKYDVNGSAQWATKQTSTGTDTGWATVADQGSNVYVVGSYGNGTFSVYNSGGAVAFTRTAANTVNSFVAKYNTSGTALWVSRWAQTGTSEGYAAAVDAGSNVYVAGYYSALITIYSGADVSWGTRAAAAGGNGGLLVKYDTTGAVQWASRSGTPTAGNRHQGVAVDQESNVYVAGQYNGNLSVYSGSDVLYNVIPQITGQDCQLIKFNTSGTVLWDTRFGSAGADLAYGIASDVSNNVYLTGYYTGAMSFWSATSNVPSATTLSQINGQDIFTAQYDKNGNFIQSARAGGTGADIGYTVACDNSVGPGRVFWGGQGAGFNFYVERVKNQGKIPFYYYNRGAVCGSLFFPQTITKQDGWANAIQQSPTAAAQINAIACDAQGNVFVAGYNTGPLTFYNSSGTASGVLGSMSDQGFIAKYLTTGSLSWKANVDCNSSSGVRINGIALDAGANLFATGYYNGYTTFFNASGTAFSNVLYNLGGTDVFLVKYSPTGTILWNAHAGSTGADVGYGITTDPQGNVLVCGSYSGTLTLWSSNDAPFANTLAVTTATDAFIAKWTNDGAVVWGTRLTSTGNADLLYATKTDNQANVFAIGSFNGTISAYNSSGTLTAATMAVFGSNDILLVKYDPAGTVLWRVRMGTTLADSLTTASVPIAIDAGSNVFCTGTYGNGSMNVFTTSDVATGNALATIGTLNCFFTKHSPVGTPLWVARAGCGASGSCSGSSVDIDSTGSVYFTGYYTYTSSALTFYNENATAWGTTYTGNTGTPDIFTVKYSTGGTVQWSARAGSTVNDTSYELAYDKLSNVIVVGSSAGRMNVYSSSGTEFGTGAINNSVGATGGFVIKFNTSGTVGSVWNATANSSTSTITVNAVKCDRSTGNIYVVGTASGYSVLFGASGLSIDQQIYPLSSSLNYFVAKYTEFGNCAWVAEGTGGPSAGLGVATDAQGNVFVTGNFVTSLTCINASGSFFSNVLTTPSSNINTFIVKYNGLNGNIIWNANFASQRINSGHDIVVDNKNNVFVTGNYYYYTQMYNSDQSVSPTVMLLTPNLLNQGNYIVKYTGDGKPLATAYMSNTLTGTSLSRVAVDNSGYIYAGGSYTGTLAIYDANRNLDTSLALNTGTQSAFVIKFSDDLATFNWSQTANTATIVTLRSLAVGPDRVFWGGSYTGDMSVYNSLIGVARFPATVTAGLGGTESFVVGTDLNGEGGAVAIVSSSSGADSCTGLSIDSTSNVYTTGFYTGTLSLNFSQDLKTSESVSNDINKYLSQINGQDIFIRKMGKYGSSFTYPDYFAARLGSTGTDTSFIDVDSLGSSVYVAGNYAATDCTFYDQNDGLFTYNRFNLKASTAGGYVTRFPLIIDIS